MLLELPHEIGFAVIAALHSYLCYRHIRAFKQLCRIHQTALNDILPAGHSEGLEIEPVEIGMAYSHFTAYLIR